GPTTTPEYVRDLIAKLNPKGIEGRLTFITRMGAGKIRTALPPLLEAVRDHGSPIAWVCDPMHGNTFETPNGYKTRNFDDVMDEVQGFFDAHEQVGTWPGGVHMELTGDDVTECLGGGEELVAEDLVNRYETACDPRLNRHQSLELAFLVAERLRGAQA
ncbi:MAG: 3-deoxy-7-phosphoheptulonate synthase class II, partial [Kribbellaceae bacterium]|nr:3-deoxy-7-phosphoheptulonate synthase class II [Kribbellaceae bacterium]